MKGKRRGRAALLALAFLLTGCGTPAPSPGKEAPSAAPAARESYQAPPLALAEFDEAAAFGKSGVLLDTSHTAQGYVAAAATSDARLKFRVSLGESKYTTTTCPPTGPRRSTRCSWAAGNTPLRCGGRTPTANMPGCTAAPKPWRWPASSSPLCAPASW